MAVSVVSHAESPSIDPQNTRIGERGRSAFQTPSLNERFPLKHALRLRLVAKPAPANNPMFFRGLVYFRLGRVILPGGMDVSEGQDEDYWGIGIGPFGEPFDAVRAALRAFPRVSDVLLLPDHVFSHLNKLRLLTSTFRVLFLSAATHSRDHNFFGISGSMSRDSSTYLWHRTRGDWARLSDPIYFAIRSAAIASFAGPSDNTAWFQALNSAAKAVTPAVIAQGMSVDMQHTEQFPEIPLADAPLWNQAPTFWLEAVDKMSDRFRDLGDPWNIVHEWYREIVEGRRPMGLERGDMENFLYGKIGWFENDDLFLSRLALALSALRSGRDIQRVPETDVILNKIWQRPAPFRFSYRPAEPIDVDFRNPVVPNNALAQTFLEEAREKALGLAEMVRNRNSVDAAAQGAIDSLLAELAVSTENINPGKLRSKFRSVEAWVLSQIVANPAEQISEDIARQAQDVVSTLMDLQSCFPEISTIEREAAKIRFSGSQESAEKVLSEISESARDLSANYPDVVTKDAADALGSFGNDVRLAPAAAKPDLLATWALTTHNYLAAGYWKLLAPVGSEIMDFTGSSYNAAKAGIVEGVKDVAKGAPQVALAYAIGGPTLAAAAMFTTFTGLKEAKEAVDRKADGKRAELP